MVGLREDGRRGSGCRVLKTFKAFCYKRRKGNRLLARWESNFKWYVCNDSCDTIEGLDADEIDPVEEENDC